MATTTALRFFDSADSYGSHPHVAEALKHVPVTRLPVLTKTWARDPATLVPISIAFAASSASITSTSASCTGLTEGDWTERYKGVMDVSPKQKKKASSARTAALVTASKRFAAATKSLWVEVHLVRINPLARTWTPPPTPSSASSAKCAPPAKGIIGMKILGRESCGTARRSPQFRARPQPPRRLTIGAESQSDRKTSSAASPPR